MGRAKEEGHGGAGESVGMLNETKSTQIQERKGTMVPPVRRKPFSGLDDGQRRALLRTSLIEMGVGVYRGLIELERIVGHRFLGGDEEGDSSMNVEEGLDRWRRRGAAGLGQQERNLGRMG